MSDLVAIAYDNVDTAQQVAANASQAQKAHLIDLEDMVVVERRMDGKVKLHQPSLAGSGAVSGALWGGLIGLIFFVPLFGMAVGAATGAIVGQMSDPGVDDEFMKRLGEQLTPGAAALIMLAHGRRRGGPAQRPRGGRPDVTDGGYGCESADGSAADDGSSVSRSGSRRQTSRQMPPIAIGGTYVSTR